MLAVGLAAACTRQAPSENLVAKQPSAAPAPAKTAPSALLAWPVARFTDAQIAEVKSCTADNRAVQVYPETVALDALPAASSLHGACDEATLAAACSKRLGTSAPPQACLDAYARAVTANPAFAFADGLIGRYFGKLVLVAPPPIARHTLVGLTLDYKWTGMGTERSWSLKSAAEDFSWVTSCVTESPGASFYSGAMTPCCARSRSWTHRRAPSRPPAAPHGGSDRWFRCAQRAENDPTSNPTSSATTCNVLGRDGTAKWRD
jgi:hypothetical protein